MKLLVLFCVCTMMEKVDAEPISSVKLTRIGHFAVVTLAKKDLKQLENKLITNTRSELPKNKRMFTNGEFNPIGRLPAALTKQACWCLPKG